jgi:hypothetical protein
VVLTKIRPEELKEQNRVAKLGRRKERPAESVAREVHIESVNTTPVSDGPVHVQRDITGEMSEEGTAMPN